MWRDEQEVCGLRLGWGRAQPADGEGLVLWSSNQSPRSVAIAAIKLLFWQCFAIGDEAFDLTKFAEETAANT